MGADPRQTGKQTYISSLITDDDQAVDGLTRTSAGALFVGNVAVTKAIVFPDGTTQTSAGVALPDHIDEGTF
jgi:hypothetical protein